MVNVATETTLCKAIFLPSEGKRRKVSRGSPGDEIEPRQAGLKGTARERLRDSIQTNASSSSWDLGRTLGKCAFPSRLEPTLSFALFGNDLSLETPTELPENEAGSGVKQESESPRYVISFPDPTRTDKGSGTFSGGRKGRVFHYLIGPLTRSSQGLIRRSRNRARRFGPSVLTVISQCFLGYKNL